MPSLHRGTHPPAADTGLMHEPYEFPDLVCGHASDGLGDARVLLVAGWLAHALVLTLRVCNAGSDTPTGRGICRSCPRLCRLCAVASVRAKLVCLIMSKSRALFLWLWLWSCLAIANAGT